MLAKRLQTALLDCQRVVTAMIVGLTSFFKGLALVARAASVRPDAQSKMMLLELSFTPIALGSVVSTSFILWLLSLPLRRWNWLTPTWDEVVYVAAWVSIELVQPFIGWFAPTWFFHVLSVQDRRLADGIRQRPILNGFEKHVLRWLLSLFKLVGVAVVGLFLAALAAPCFATMTAALFGAGPLTLVALLAGAGFLLRRMGVAWLKAPVLRLLAMDEACAPILRLFRWDPILAAIAVLALCFRLASARSVKSIVKGAFLLYYSSTLVTKQMLAQYSKRLSRQEWAAFKRRHCWEMFAFGLPVWGAARYSPLMVVALCQVFHGASAALLADLLANDA